MTPITEAAVEAGAKFFPIMFGGYRAKEEVAALRNADVCFGVVCIPWDMILPHERQALRNHSQTLKRLAERGGLSASEAVAVLEDRDFRRMGEAEAHHRLAGLVAAFAAPPPPAPDAAGEDDAAYWKGVAERALSKQIDMVRENDEAMSKMRSALEWIRDAHIPDQPAATNGSEFDWAVRWVRTLRLHAQTALEAAAAPKPGSGV